MLCIVKSSDFKESLKILKRLVTLMEKNDFGNGNVRAKYAEMYVADKLRKYNPQIGYERDVTNSDIYLSDMKKRIEVKSSIFKEDYWDWAFSPKQIKNEKFDYCVLIGFNDKGIIKKIFVMTYEELEKHPLLRENGQQNNTYIMYSTKYSESSEYSEGDSKVELDLNKYPEKFENRWDKIK